MMKTCVKWIVTLAMLSAPIFSLAAVPAWQMIPAKSSLTFTAIQNGSPVTGEFKTFTSEINFDPDQLSESHVKIVVDIASVSDTYNKLSETLKSDDWLNVKAFPQAIFISNKFAKTSDKMYECQGTLTIRNKTLPVTLTFTQEEYSQTNAQMKGSTVVKRTAFGVGQGEWADTKIIEDSVKINFIITAVKK